MSHVRRIVALVLPLVVLVLPVPARGAESYVFSGILGGPHEARVVHGFEVSRISTLTVALRRSDPSVRMTFRLRDPSGEVVARGDASTLEDEPLVWAEAAPGTWRVVLRVRDGRVAYELRVEVSPMNRAPVAGDDTASTMAGQPVSIHVLDNDRDPDGDPLSVVSVDPAPHGSLTIGPDGSVTYLPEASFSGAEVFAYRVCDGGAPSLCATASVGVAVEASSTSPTPSPSPSESPSPDASRTGTSISLAPLVKGLSTRWSYSRELPAYIQRVAWSDLQPSAYGPIVHPNPIDQAIARGVPFRVRLLAGGYAPSWVFVRAGSVEILDTFLGANQTYVVPRWWTRAYADAYADLIAKLAVDYDGLIPAISMSGPMTIAAEPFLHQFTASATRQAALAAGWSTAAERSAFERMIDAHAAFRSTRTFMAINPGQTYDGGTGKWNLADLAYMRSLTDRFVSVLGPRAIVQNNSLNVTRATEKPAYVAMYDYMGRLHAAGVPIAFQTAQTALVEDLPWVLDYAVQAGAHLVELPADWQLLDTPEHLALVDQQLRANEP